MLKEEQGLERAREAQERHTDALLARGAIGTAVGLGANGQPVVKIYTAAAVAGLPQELDGVPTQVEVTGEFVAQSDPKDKFPRPVPIGVSSGTERLKIRGGLLYCTVGTLGARVTDGTNVWALSNAHVYALGGRSDWSQWRPHLAARSRRHARAGVWLSERNRQRCHRQSGRLCAHRDL